MSVCPDCGALGTAETCAEHFHTLLAWEWEYNMQDVHHLLVLCYHIQHPHLYSSRTLADSIAMLVDFLEGGVTPAQMRKRMAKSVGSDVREHKIKGTPEDHGAYAQPVPWTLTVADMVAAGPEAYYASVEAWARSMLAALRAGGYPNT